MESLGRLCNVVAIAASRPLNLSQYKSVMFVTTGADTFTITTGPSFATNVTATTTFDHYYQQAGTTGGFAWTRVALGTPGVGLAAFTQASAYQCAFHIESAWLPDGEKYIKCVPSAGGLISAYLYDLSSKRAPVNLPIVSV